MCSEHSTTLDADFNKSISKSIFGVFINSLKCTGGGDCSKLGWNHGLLINLQNDDSKNRTLYLNITTRKK